MPIAEHPLHGSVRALLMHTALTSGNNAHSLERIRMVDLNFWEPAVNEPIHSWPCQRTVLASPSKHVEPVATDLLTKITQGASVVWHSVIAVMSTNDRPQPFSLFGNWLMHAPAQLYFQLLKLCSHFLFDRSPKNRKHAIAPFHSTNVGEPQEPECFRSTRSTLLPVSDRIWTKFQNPRLLGMKFKTELEHALFQVGQKLLGLRFMFKSHNKVVSPTHDNHLAARFVLPSLLCPQIKNVMKINIRKQGTDAPALRYSFFRFFSAAFDHDTSLEPFLDQADHSLILNSMFDKFDQPFVVEIVEKAPDVSIQDPVHSSRKTTDIQGIETVVLPFTRPVAIREPEKVCLIDRVQNFNRTSLDDLVFQNRYPQGTLLPVGFGYEHSAYRLCSVSTLLQSLQKILKIFFKILSVADPRLAINSGCGSFLHREVGCSKPINVRNMVHQVGELHLLIASCDFAYTVKRTLHTFSALSPLYVLLAMFPSVSRLPSIPLRRRVCTALVRELRRYFASVRLPMIVRHRRASLDFTMRTSGVAPLVDHGISRFSRRLFRSMLKVFDPAGFHALLPLRSHECGLPRPPRTSTPGLMITGLNTWPTSNPVNASSVPSRILTHDSGTLPMASRLKVKFNTNTNLPVYPGAQEVSNDC